jgi:predicted enzyme related to lactoylglutathione lyase
MVTIFDSFANKKILLNFILKKFSLLYTISTLNMKKVTGIGGIFFKSKDPKAITAWYAQNLGLQTNPYGATFEWYEDAEGKKKADTQWAPFGDNTKYFEPSTKEFMINYRVENLEALVEELKANGVTLVDEIETFDYGKFIHILDPEGNKIELWEPMG